MSRRTLLVLLFLAALPMRADFSSVAGAIDAQHGVKRIWIPFLGIARALVWVARPEGVHDFQLATFAGGKNLSPDQLLRILETQAGPGFRPLVRTWSRRSGEWSFIYAKNAPGSDRIELMVLTRDHDDTVLVRVDVDANVLARELDDPRGVVKVARR